MTFSEMTLLAMDEILLRIEISRMRKEETRRRASGRGRRGCGRDKRGPPQVCFGSLRRSEKQTKSEKQTRRRSGLQATAKGVV